MRSVNDLGKLSRVLVVLLPALIMVALGLTFFSSAGRDDLYISFWPAHTLAQFGEMVNYNGERVEQSSSLLHVLALALTSRLTGVPVERIGPLFTIAAGVAGLIAAYRLALRLHPGTAALTPFLIATSAYYIYWSFGGLETTLMAFTAIFLVLACASYVQNGRHLGWAAVSIVLFVMVRPETPIVLGCILLGALVLTSLKGPGANDQHQATMRRLVALVVIGGAASGGVVAFRLLYFGSPFPQPVFAKSGGLQSDGLLTGLNYLRRDFIAHVGSTIMFVAVALSGFYAAWTLLRAEKLDFYLAFSLLLLAAYLSFVLLSGGDWMEGGRFLVHVLPVAMALVPFAMAERGWNRATWKVSGGLLVGFQVWFLVVFAAKASLGMPIWSGVAYYRSWGDEFGASRYSWFDRTNRTHIRDIPAIERLNQIVAELSEYKQSDVEIMSHQMGMVAFYVSKAHYGQVHFTDVHGLADRALTDCPVTSGLAREAEGLRIQISDYLTMERELAAECDIPSPDVIFGVFDTERLTDHGYTIVHIQHGDIETHSSWLPGTWGMSFQYIAVRNDLLPALKNADPVVIDFSTWHP
jgi:hypothetical protein